MFSKKLVILRTLSIKHLKRFSIVNFEFTKNNSPKKPLFLVFTYLGPLSLQTRTKLRKSFRGILICCKYQIVFKSQNKLSNSNYIRTHNRLVRKRTLNHLSKLAKWFSCVLGTYLYGVFDCMPGKLSGKV